MAGKTARRPGVHCSVHSESRTTIQALPVARRKRRAFVARRRSAKQELRSARLRSLELGPGPRAEMEYLAKAVRRARLEKRTDQSPKDRLARQSATLFFLVRRNRRGRKVLMWGKKNRELVEQLPPPLANRI